MVAGLGQRDQFREDLVGGLVLAPAQLYASPAAQYREHLLRDGIFAVEEVGDGLVETGRQPFQGRHRRLRAVVLQQADKPFGQLRSTERFLGESRRLPGLLDALPESQFVHPRAARSTPVYRYSTPWDFIKCS